jgi:hypothetical protein
MLPSGLPEIVDDGESLARFLTQSGHYNHIQAKPVAFLPNPNDRTTSVSRHAADAVDELWAIGEMVVAESGRNLHGAVIIEASAIRKIGLDIISDEPPPRHAVISDWPWEGIDPEAEKARRKDLANQLASAASAPILKR